MYRIFFVSVCMASLIVGCSSLGSFSYNDYSQPKAPQSFEDQSVVSGSLNAPLDSVCHLTTTRKNYKTLWFGNTPYTGSAALINGRFLITAAHNVYDYPFSYLTSVSVSCAVKSVSNESVQIKLDREKILRNISIPRYEFKVINRSKKYEFDYAFIDLGKNITVDSGFHIPEQSAINVGDSVNISGYPGGLISDAHTLHKGTGVISDIDGNLASYSLNTATGNSGGPIWIYDGNNQYYLVAVHVKNYGGRVINESFLSDWKDWLAERN